MKKCLCTIALVLSLVTLADGQQSPKFSLRNITPFSPPLIPYRAGPPTLPTSRQLQELGAYSFQFLKLSKKNAVVALFDNSLRQIGTVEMKLTGEPQRPTFFYTMHVNNGAQAWIKIDTEQNRKNQALFHVTASSGKDLQIQISLNSKDGANSRANHYGISAIRTFVNGRWRAVSLSSLGTDPSQSQFESVLQNEEKTLFVTPELRVLQRVILDIERMAQSAYKFGTRSSSLAPDPTCNDVACIRIAYFPFFACDGGRQWCQGNCPNAKGVFFIPECVISFYCIVDCRRFPGPIYTLIETAADCINNGFTWNSSTNICEMSSNDCSAVGGTWSASGCLITATSCAVWGMSWDSVSGMCTGSHQTLCEYYGWFWNFTSGTCSDTPQNQDQCESASWFWNPFTDSCQSDAPPPCEIFPEVCENGIWSLQWCGCVPYNTPILIDAAGNGFNLTNSEGGTNFNLNARGGSEKIAWTNGGSDDAWLVLDRNGNGTIDNGAELFGDVTPQTEPPVGEKKNGFRALAEYDVLTNGGNGNGQIESGDSVFSSLRLWQDENHNGLSEPSELHTLPSKNVAAIELDFKYSKKTDSHGNQFSFRAKVKNSQGQQLGRWAWDVYLLKSE